MPQEFYTISLISVIGLISFSTLYASRLVGIRGYSQSAITVFHLYFIFGFLGWLLFGLAEFSDLYISLSWLATAYFLASFMLLFMIIGRVDINKSSVLWSFSHVLFIVMVITAQTLESELWVFTFYVLIHLGILSYVAKTRIKALKNVGFNIISLALYIPLSLAAVQAYMLLNQYSLGNAIGLGILGAAASYSLVGLGFLTMMLVSERDSYELQANKDELTDVYNRRGLNSALEYVVAESLREQTSLSAIVCDIDFFKKINDTHGHDVGDIVLKEFSTMLKASLRASDLLARTGGEEFVLILPKADLTSAKMVAEKLRKNTENMVIQIPGSSVNLTASFGVANQIEKINIDNLIKSADKAVYEAKALGRNRVSFTQNIM